MKYIFSILLGLLIGLPQGLKDQRSFFKAESLPGESIIIFVVISLVGGVMMGLTLLRKDNQIFSLDSGKIYKYLEPYTFMLVLTLSTGLPILLNHVQANIYASVLWLGWFFCSIAAGLLMAGVIKQVARAKT